MRNSIKDNNAIVSLKLILGSTKHTVGALGQPTRQQGKTKAQKLKKSYCKTNLFG
jgi:hypothetical protein